MRESRDIDGEVQGGGLPIGRIFSVIRRRWRLMAAIVLSVTVLSGGVSLVLPDLYEAHTLVQIDPRDKTISDLKDVISDLNGDAASIESEVEVILSEGIARKVIDILDLRNDPELSRPTGIGAILELVGLLPGQPVRTLPANRPVSGEDATGLSARITPGTSQPLKDEVAEAFASRLKAQRVRSTLLISIGFRATDPVKAAKIVNTVAEVYLAEQLASKQRLTLFASQALEKKLTDMRKSVMDAEKKVEAFKAANGIFATEGQILSEKRLARLMEQTVMARNDAATARAKYEQARRLVAEGADRETVSDVLESNTVRLIREKLVEATRKRAELATKYGPRHPDIIKINAEVGDIRQQLDGEISRLIERLENDYLQARNREAELRSNLIADQNGEAETKSKSVVLNELERDAKTSRTIFEALLARYKQTTETQDLQLPDARIVEQASVPLRPSSPKRRTIVLMGFAGGLALALLLIIGQEFMTPGIGRPEDVEGLLSLPHLASLPSLSDGSAGETTRLAVAQPSHEFVEAVRHARRELDLDQPPRHGRVSLVCAALPGEGTSLISSNLAHHYALTGQRVLLIDADLRRSKLSRQLAADRGSGLSGVLSGHHPPEAAILQDETTGLCFMPATHSGPQLAFNPEVLASPVFSQTIHRLRSYFDVIIVDAPPILPVIDTQFLADSADQLVYVMTWRKTPRVLAKKAVRALGENADKIVGVVVNKVDPVIIEDELGFVPGRKEFAHA